jgi:hypothetical protein
MTAQTVQAKNHNEKQDYVGRERGNDIMTAAVVCVEYSTGALRR